MIWLKTYECDVCHKIFADVPNVHRYKGEDGKIHISGIFCSNCQSVYERRMIKRMPYIKLFDKLREAHDKWNSLRHASLTTDNYKEAVDYNNREADAQKERYEWLLNDISENYVNKTKGGTHESTKV